MKIRKSTESALSLSEIDINQLKEINSVKYFRVNISVKVVVILLTVLLPLLYLNLIAQEWFVDSDVINNIENSYFVLYKTIYVSHILSMFIFIPSGLLLLFYSFVRRYRDYHTYTVLSSAFLYSATLKKYCNHISSIPLEEKIGHISDKIIRKLRIFTALSVLLGAILLFLDNNNYIIITEDYIEYKRYATFSHHKLGWGDLRSVHTGCKYNNASYKNAFIKAEWYYYLIFDDHFVVNLHDLVALKGDFTDNIYMVNTITKAFRIPQIENQSKNLLLPKIPKNKCMLYIRKNYSNGDYEKLLKILRFNSTK